MPSFEVITITSETDKATFKTSEVDREVRTVSLGVLIGEVITSIINHEYFTLDSISGLNKVTMYIYLYF